LVWGFACVEQAFDFFVFHLQGVSDHFGIHAGGVQVSDYVGHLENSVLATCAIVSNGGEHLIFSRNVADADDWA
jgi:hypothetical protein